MENQNDSPLKFMTRGIRVSVDRCETDLKTVTEFLDRHFEGLEAEQLPAYRNAVEAIQAYKEALVSHFNKKYQESESSEPTS